MKAAEQKAQAVVDAVRDYVQALAHPTAPTDVEAEQLRATLMALVSPISPVEAP